LCANDKDTCNNLALVIMNDLINALFQQPVAQWFLQLGPDPIPTTLTLLLQLILTPEC
jgi:hypothetical protein